eukprot:jgi/Tetstr1/454936/TSEL_041797.t1
MEQQMPMRNTRHNVSAPAADSEVQLPARKVRQSSPTPDKEQQGAAEGRPQLVKVVDRGLKSPGADGVQEARVASTKQTLPPESVQQAATPTGSKEPELPQSATDTQALRGARQARAPAAAKAQLPESAEEGAPGTSKELQPPETHLEPLQPPPGGGHLPDAGAAPQSPGRTSYPRQARSQLCLSLMRRTTRLNQAPTSRRQTAATMLGPPCPGRIRICRGPGRTCKHPQFTVLKFCLRLLWSRTNLILARTSCDLQLSKSRG